MMDNVQNVRIDIYLKTVNVKLLVIIVKIGIKLLVNVLIVMMVIH
jgi:hypothetical protein